MSPYYYGFCEQVRHTYLMTNFFCQTRLKLDPTQITQLPIKSWTQDYKEFLKKILTGDKDKKCIYLMKGIKLSGTPGLKAF